MFPSLFTIIWKLGGISIETTYIKILKFIMKKFMGNASMPPICTAGLGYSLQECLQKPPGASIPY